MPNIRTPSLISRRCETHSDYSNFQPCLTFNPHHILKTTDRLSKEVSYPLFRNRGYYFQLQISKPRNSATGFWRPTELLKKNFTRNPRKFVIPYFLPKRKTSVMLQMGAASSGHSWHPKEARRSKSGWFLFQVRSISIGGGAKGSIKCRKMLRREWNEEWEITESGSLMLMTACKKIPGDGGSSKRNRVLKQSEQKMGEIRGRNFLSNCVQIWLAVASEEAWNARKC